MLKNLTTSSKHFINVIPGEGIVFSYLKNKSKFYNKYYLEQIISRDEIIPGHLGGGNHA
ncbi:MAG: hypothetical protein ACYDEE_14530 [Ignavibacteriaceae bacterium]